MIWEKTLCLLARIFHEQIWIHRSRRPDLPFCRRDHGRSSPPFHSQKGFRTSISGSWSMSIQACQLSATIWHEILPGDCILLAIVTMCSSGPAEYVPFGFIDLNRTFPPLTKLVPFHLQSPYRNVDPVVSMMGYVGQSCRKRLLTKVTLLLLLSLVIA